VANLTQEYEILTPHGWCDFKGIQKLENREVMQIIFEDFSDIVCTFNHTFIVDGKDIKADTLKIGDKLQIKDSYKTIFLIGKKENATVFDILNVDNIDSSFYANGIISHNCSFEGSSKTLLSGAALERLAKMARDPIKRESEYFSIWSHPKPRRVYVAGVDVGSGAGSDNSVVEIYDVTDYYTSGYYELVALYKRNDINVFDFASTVELIVKRYNNASIICENNGTGLGGIFLNQLYMEIGYENIYYDYDNETLGVNANAQTKPMAVTNFKEDVEANICRLYSNSMLIELRIYEENKIKPGKFAAKRGDGNMDDQVSAGYWVSFLLRTRWWDDNKNDFYNKVISSNATRDEEVEAEKDLENFKRVFNDEGHYSPEQDMLNFEREMMEGN
jgi:hypothetical protein